MSADPGSADAERAIVVGSGPNGLAAAVRLAQAGLSVTVLEAADTAGGGLRSSELTLPGLTHDHCSAFHPTGVASPYLSTLGLERHGLRWLLPEIQLAHPLDGGRAGLLHQSLERTVAGLGADGPAWRRYFGYVVDHLDTLLAETFGPLLRVPRHPLVLGRFGPRAVPAASLAGRLFRTDEGRALFGGGAAHIFGRLDRPLSSAVGAMLTATAHGPGWPVAEGGSQSIADALIARLEELGGSVVTGHRVTSAAEVAGAGTVIYDLMPGAVARLIGDRMPTAVRRAFSHYRFGPGAFKVDLAIEGAIPWTDPEVGRAGTVHLGGSFAEIADAEAQTVAGRMPQRPFVLLGQQWVADPGRSRDGINPVYAYAHVPAGYDGDATDAVLAQIERFAPGFRDRIVATSSRGPADLEAANANLVGGDIAGGSTAGQRVVLRPRITLNPYRTGVDGHYLCSAATPPGAGTHGMGGFHAAETALRDLGR